MDQDSNQDINQDTIKKLWALRGIKKKNMSVKIEKFPELAQQHEQNLYRFKSVNPLVLSQQVGKKDVYATSNYKNKKHMINSAQGQYHLSFIKAYLINHFEGQAQQNQKKQQHKQHKLLHSQAQLDKINFYKYQMGEIHIDNYLHSILSRIHKSQRNPRHKARQVNFDIVDQQQQFSLQQNNSAISHENLPTWYPQQVVTNYQRGGSWYAESEGTQGKRKSNSAKTPATNPKPQRSIQKQQSQVNNSFSLQMQNYNGNISNKRKSSSSSDKKEYKGSERTYKKNSSINNIKNNDNNHEVNISEADNQQKIKNQLAGGSLENLNFSVQCCFCTMQAELKFLNSEEIALLQLKQSSNKIGKKKFRQVMQLLELQQENLWEAGVVVCGHEECMIFMHIDCAKKYRESSLNLGNSFLCLHHQSDTINEQISQNENIEIPIKQHHKQMMDEKFQAPVDSPRKDMDIERETDTKPSSPNQQSEIQYQDSRSKSLSQTNNSQNMVLQDETANKGEQQEVSQMEGIEQEYVVQNDEQLPQIE